MADNTAPPVDSPPPSGAVPEDEHHHPSSPTPVVEVESQPTPVSVTADNDHAAPSPGPLVISQQSPLDSTPPTTPSTPTGRDAITTTDHPEDHTTIPTPPKVFVFDGSSNFITSSVIDYLETIPGGEGWVNMIKAYLRLEELPAQQGVRGLFRFPNYILIFSQCPRRIPAESRPAEVGMWMKTRSFSADRLPFISDTGAYGRMWIAWWMACQPSWRKNCGWPLPKDRGSNTKWGKLAARSQNGIFILVVSTTWWAASLKPTDLRDTFDEAVEDMRWVIEQLIESSLPPAPGVADIARGPLPPQGPREPTSTATWQARGDGKRKSRPSRKLLEAMS